MSFRLKKGPQRAENRCICPRIGRALRVEGAGLRRAVGVCLGLALLGVGAAVSLLGSDPPHRAAVSAAPAASPARPAPLPAPGAGAGAAWSLELHAPDVRGSAVATPLVAHAWHTPSSQVLAEPLLLDGLPLDLHVRAARAPVAEAPLALLLVAGGSALGAWRARRRGRGEAPGAT